MTDRDTKELLEQERRYFLPKSESLLAKQWNPNGEDGTQFLYAECCRYGVNKIAQEVLEYKDGSQTFLLAETLYQMAAKVRTQPLPAGSR